MDWILGEGQGIAWILGEGWKMDWMGVMYLEMIVGVGGWKDIHRRDNSIYI